MMEYTWALLLVMLAHHNVVIVHGGEQTEETRMFADIKAHEAAKYLHNYNAMAPSDVQSAYIEMLRESLHNETLNELALLWETTYDVTQDDKLRCYTDTLTMLEDLRPSQNETYAFQMLDATGKLPSGVLEGNFYWMGNYDQCKRAVKLYPNSTAMFRGQYCFARIYIPSLKQLAVFGGLSLGVCIPNSCNETDVAVYLSLVVKLVSTVLPMSVQYALCEEEQAWTTGAKVALVILSLFGLLCLIGSACDLYLRWKRSTQSSPNQDKDDSTLTLTDHDTLQEQNCMEENTPEPPSPQYSQIMQSQRDSTGILMKFLLCFSWITNGGKLLDSTVRTGNLTAINGIRVLSMWWVILGHTFSVSITTFENPLSAFLVLQRASFQAVANASFSVDSFFFLSGMLVTYLTLKQLHGQDGRLNPAMYYFHRFWRLTPVYMIVLMFYTTLFSYMPNGPFAVASALTQYGVTACHKYWWTNLLYISNLYPSTLTEECMAWGWFLSNDMQFFIVSPLFIYILYKKWKVGIVVTMATLVGFVTLTGVMSWHEQLSAILGDKSAVNSDLYIRPYYRIPSYLVGMLTGFIVYKAGGNLKMNKIVVLGGWFMAAAVNLSVLYGLSDYYRHPRLMSTALSAFYNAVSRPAWCAGLGWVTIACLNGYGGPVNTFLSWGVWGPLGRLTYCAYLVHPLVIIYAVASFRHPIYYTDLSMIYLYISHLVIAYMVAFVTSLLVEAPMLALEKLIFPRRQQTQQQPMVVVSGQQSAEQS